MTLKKKIPKMGVMEKRRHVLFLSRTCSAYRTWVKRSGKTNFDLKDLRKEVEFALDHGGCPYCNARLKVRTFSIDHRTPLSREGTASMKNLMVCCRSCNLCKGEMTESEYQRFRSLLNQFPEKVKNDIVGRMKAGASVKRLRFLSH